MIDFNIDDNLAHALYLEGIKSDEQVCYALEQYRIASRDEILRVLRSSFLGLQFNSIDEVIRTASLIDLEAKYGVILQKTDSTTIDIIVPIFKSVDRNSLELELCDYSFTYVYVTPYNYELLLHDEADIEKNCVLVYKRLIYECIKQGASDLHLGIHHYPDETRCYAKARYKNDLVKLDLFKLSIAEEQSLVLHVIKNCTNANTDDIDTPEGLSTSIICKADNFFKTLCPVLRLDVRKELDGYKFVTRIQTATTSTLSLEQLGLDDERVNCLRRIARKQTGLTLVCGPIRTGKNTTVFAILREIIQKYNRSIMSCESPIELLLPIDQIDVQYDDRKLQGVIVSAKKQDVDIMYVNEIPSKEIALAVSDLVNASIGIITTLHVDRLWRLPYKLFEYYGSSYKDIISQINGVFVQKLLPVLCPKCSKTVLVSDLNLHDQTLLDTLKKYAITSVYESQGCEECVDPFSSTVGYVPRKLKPFMEFLEFTDDVKDALLQCNTPYEMERYLKQFVREQAHTFEDTLCNSIKSGVIHYSALYDL